MKMVIEERRELPVLYDGYEIVVVGGGIAGVAAALAAAREGKKVLLLERMFTLGGLATLGLVTIYLPLCDGEGHQVIYGIAEELFRLSISKGWECSYPDTWLGKESAETKTLNSLGKVSAETKTSDALGEQNTERANCGHGNQRFEVRYNAQVFAVLMEQALTQAGVDILYGTSLCQVIRNGNRVEALIVENKDGRSAVPVQGVVDASGDADVFYLAGAATEQHKIGNKLAAWYYETIEGKTKLHMVGASDVPSNSSENEDPDDVGTGRITGVDAKILSKWLLESHALSLEKFLEKGSVSEAHSFATMATIPQLRMTRKLAGRYTLDDTEDHKHFEDSIGMTGDWRKRGPVYEIPMRALCSEELVNVTAAGRCISVTDAMWDITRVIPTAAVTGQAAGLMLAVNDDTSKLQIEELQQALRRQKVKLHLEEVLPNQDDK